ncbi:thioredoxin family protein [Flavobacterium branchiicola]|uniref:Thioredoxin family protein n=1 Tax=Flavobacterium branchiicola TaxID=1114875 RepID=A0ABV9PFE7_9FLAO|nr:thioredoxin family protein [Flavobacterium branchiicola]MBS7255296.1 thioredoxin family protein [Flavobacterium branchiicola]
MKKLFLFLLFFGITSTGFCQLKNRTFEEVDSLQHIQKRKIIIFIHTDWCQFCQHMKATTFKNQEIINKLNSNFYFIDFNAEEKREITFNNRTFKYQPSGNDVGVHELALQLGTNNKQLIYPALCVLNEKNEIVFQSSSDLSVSDFIILLGKLEK